MQKLNFLIVLTKAIVNANLFCLFIMLLGYGIWAGVEVMSASLKSWACKLIREITGGAYWSNVTNILYILRSSECDFNFKCF